MNTVSRYWPRAYRRVPVKAYVNAKSVLKLIKYSHFLDGNDFCGAQLTVRLEKLPYCGVYNGGCDLESGAGRLPILGFWKVGKLVSL